MQCFPEFLDYPNLVAVTFSSPARLARRMQRGPRWLRWLAFDPLNFIATEYLRWTRQSDCILVVGTKCTIDQKGRTGTLGNAVLS